MPQPEFDLEALRARQAAARAEAAQELDHDRFPSAAAIANCELCDDDGYRNESIVCDHIDRTESAARGIAMVRQALADAKRMHLEPGDAK